jgi:hypothetical protein
MKTNSSTTARALQSRSWKMRRTITMLLHQKYRFFMMSSLLMKIKSLIAIMIRFKNLIHRRKKNQDVKVFRINKF